MRTHTGEAEKADILDFLNRLSTARDPSILRYCHAVLEVSISANQALYETLREESSMNAVRQLFQDEFHQMWTQGRDEGIELGRNEGIKLGRNEGIERGRILLSAQYVKQGITSAADAARVLGLSTGQFISKAAELGCPLD